MTGASRSQRPARSARRALSSQVFTHAGSTLETEKISRLQWACSAPCFAEERHRLSAAHEIFAEPTLCGLVVVVVTMTLRCFAPRAQVTPGLLLRSARLGPCRPASPRHRRVRRALWRAGRAGRCCRRFGRPAGRAVVVPGVSAPSKRLSCQDQDRVGMRSYLNKAEPRFPFRPQAIRTISWRACAECLRSAFNKVSA